MGPDDTEDEEDEAHATQSDALDDAPPSNEAAAAISRVWGRLLSAEDSTVALVLEGDGPFVIGRNASCDLRVANSRISSLHARLAFSVASGVTIEDLSTNGVWRNGQRLSKGGPPHALNHLDELALSGSPSPTDSTKAPAARFVFAVPAATRHVTAATAPATATAAATAEPGPSSASGGSGEAAAAAGDDDVEKNLMCGICQDLLHRPVALQPCQHVFCGGCLCGWARRQQNCPECRQPVRVVARNHVLSNIVAAHLAKHPEKAREASELERLDQADTIGNAPRAIRKRDREEGMEMFDYGEADESEESGEEGYSDDDDDDDDSPLAQQMAAAYRAAMAQIPAIRAAIGGAMHGVMCSGCHSRVPAAQLVPMSARQPDDLPAGALINAFEREVISSHLASKAVTPHTLLTELLARAASGELSLLASAAGPPADPASPVCDGCFERAFNHLLLQYRRALPANELPEAVTRRDNCWYGTTCRTQAHNRQHAARLNHICEPSRGGGGRGGGRGRGRGGGGGGAQPPPAQPPPDGPPAPPAAPIYVD